MRRLTAIFCLTLAVLLLPALALGEKVKLRDLVVRNDLFYKKSTDVPFSGKVTGETQGKIKDGKAYGLWVIKSESGQLIKKGFLKDGKQDGPWIEYRESGQLSKKGTYKDGKKDGPWFSYLINGQLYFKGTYKGGKKHGPWVTYHDNGQLKVKGTYKDGKEDGDFVRYAIHGQLRYRVTFKDGKPVNPSSDYQNYVQKLQKAWEEKTDKLLKELWEKEHPPKIIGTKSPPSPTIKKKQVPKPSPNKKSASDPNKIIPASSGSGFSVSSQGHVITYNHVINGCNKVKIHHDGRSISARVITYDPQNDLALLKGDFRPTTVFSLSNQKPELLQDIYVAGYPFGQKLSTSVKVTKGIISSLTGIGNNFSNIQIDAALQPGNSGGPILSDRGNVVGVAVAKLDLKKVLKNFGVIPEDTNFGIKTSVVRSLLESSNVSLRSPNTKSISKSKLGKMISDGTYYLSCWMTAAQIQKMRAKKVIFSNLE